MDRRVNILLVEDNPADVRLMREALGNTSERYELQVATSGTEALEALGAAAGEGGAAPIDFVILDLNLPGVHGLEVLETMKADERLRRIPVAILTSSTSQEDVARSYDLHASCYITKPVEIDDYFEMADQIRGFWLQLVRLPRQE